VSADALHQVFGAQLGEVTVDTGLQGKRAVIGRRQLLAQRWQVVQSPANTEMSAVVGAGFSAQNAVAASITADVVFDE
jgi:hypothetical protein